MLPEQRKQLARALCKAVIRYKLLAEEINRIEQFNSLAEFGLYNPQNKQEFKRVLATNYVDLASKREVVLNTIKDIFSQLTETLNFGFSFPILSKKEIEGTSAMLGSPIGDSKEYMLNLNTGEVLPLTNNPF